MKKKIVTEEGHEADANGKIYYKGKPCFIWTGTSGYEHVRLYGGKIQKQVHRLVCLAFHGLPPDKKMESSVYQCHHINGNPLDNRATNLQWIDKEAHQLATSLGLDLKYWYQVTDLRNGFTYPGALHLGQVHNIVNTNQSEFNGLKLKGVLVGGQPIEKEKYTKAQIKTAGLNGQPIAGIFKLRQIVGVPHKKPLPAPLFE